MSAGPPQPARRASSGSRAGAPLLAAAAAWAAASAAADPSPADRPVVEVGTVSVRPVNIESWIPGSIVSRSDARIASVIAGRVVWIADVGTRVGAGEALARLDDTVSR
jgi:multidrug efflux pump subunit AcrA (membrane-fusion protein)